MMTLVVPVVHVICFLILFYFLDDKFIKLGYEGIRNERQGYTGNVFSSEGKCRLESTGLAGTETPDWVTCTLPMNVYYMVCLIFLYWVYGLLMVLDLAIILKNFLPLFFGFERR